MLLGVTFLYLIVLAAFLINIFLNFNHRRKMEAPSIIEVKSIIRGLLVSSPEVMTVLKLRHDFKDQEGHDIPFFEFGFHDVTSFLRSIPDVCQVCNNVNGPYAIVRLVESDKSAHVSSLVMRQRTTAKRPRRRPSLQLHRKSSQVNFKYNLWSQPKERFYSSQNYKVNEDKVLENQINNVIHKKASTSRCAEFHKPDPFCSSSTNGFMPFKEPSFAQKRSKENGDECHSSVPDIPHVPDVFGNEFTDLESLVDHHLKEILSGKGMHLNEVTEYLKNSLIKFGEVCPEKVEEIIRKLPYFKIVNDYVYYSELPTDEEIRLEEASHLPEIETDAAEIDMCIQDVEICDIESLRGHTDLFIPTSTNEKIQRLERNLYSLMKDHCEGILGCDLKDKYKMKFAAPLNCKIVDCDTVWELAIRMPHIFNLIPLENGECKLFPFSHHSGQMTKEPKPIFVRSEKEPVVPALMRRNIQRFMQDYPNGLQSKDFEQRYKESYMGRIELQQMGFSSIDEFLTYLEKINVLQIEGAESDIWLLPSSISGHLTVDEDPLPSHELMKTEVDIDALKQRFPNDVIGPDVHIEQVKIPSWIQMRSMVEICVQEVKNPHCFWITFRGEQYKNALESLMDDLQVFYCSKSYGYKMPEDLIREGQDCVTQYVGEWHRARITCIISTCEAEVCFYDYGTTRIVQKNNIHYLHISYSALPAQAIRATLAGVEPVGNEWTQEASKRFLQIISYKALIGIVRTVDRQNNVISLFLCDTSGDDDVYIHDVLVTEGIAVESATNFNQNESKNDVESEELLGNQYLQEENEPDENALETISSNRVLENLNPHSDVILENYDKHDEEKDAFCQLPHTLLNNVAKNHQSVSTPTSFPADSTSLVTETSSKSAMFVKPFPPPPGFSHVNKSATEGVCDKREFQASSLAINQAKKINEEENKDLIEINSIQALKTTKKIENQKISEIAPKKANLRGTAKGINSNFVNGKSSLQNNYNYSNWAPVPSTYQFSPASSTFPTVPVNPVSALSPLPFGPYSLAMPNPWDYCNYWYYEQCRQQAFVQGMLAHQQIAAATFPPLPPGMFQPNSYSAVSTQNIPQNYMNISEVHSSEPLLVEKTLEEPCAESQANIICTATQTDLPLDVEISDKDLKTAELPHANVSTVEAVSIATALRNEEDTCLHENVSSSKLSIDKVPIQDDDTAREANSSLNITAKDDISCQENVFDSHNSFFQNTVNHSIGFSEPNSKTICISNSSENVISKFQVEKSADTDICVIGLKDAIQSESLCLNQTSNHSKTLQVESAAKNYFGIENHSKPDDSEANTHLKIDCGVRSTVTSQVFCNLASEDNLISPTSKSTNEENDVRSVEYNDTGIPRQEMTNIFDKEIGCVENKVHESSQVGNSNFKSLCAQEIILNENNIQEQEIMKKSLQECVINEVNLNINENSTQLSHHVMLPEKLTFKEYNGLTKEKQINELTSKHFHSSSTPAYLLNLNEEHHNQKIEVRCLIDQADNLEVSPDHSLKCSQHLPVKKIFEEKSDISHRHGKNIFKLSTSDALLSEFDALRISNEKSNVIAKVPNIQKCLPLENQRKIEDTVSEVQENLSSTLSTKKKPELGVKLCSEVSSSIILGPTELPKTCPTNWMTQTTSPTHSLQTKNSLSCNSKTYAQTVSRKSAWVTEEINKPVVPNQIDLEPSKKISIDSRIKNVSKKTAENWHKESHSSSRKTNYQFVKKIKLGGKNINQINLDGRPYVLTDEIIGTFTPFNGRHVIIKILEARKVEINFLEMSRKRRPEFFECLDKSDIKHLCRGPTGFVIGSVHIVPLRSVPYMLRALNKDDAALSEEVKEEMEKFDASDPYWFGYC